MALDPLLAPSRDSFADMVCSFVILARGRNAENRPCWSYIALKPSMALSFKDACSRGNVSLEEYGTVIEEGIGENPPETIKTLMERDFGVRHELEDKLSVAIEQFS